MELIFVIGGIGSGKSTVVDAFRACSLPCYDLDQLGHDVLLDAAVAAELARTFGPDILDADGQVLRPVLAQRAFADDASTRILSSITHPAIWRKLDEALVEQERNGARCVVVEASALASRADIPCAYPVRIIAVVAPLEQRLQRLAAKEMDCHDAENRIAAQADDETLCSMADIVLVNDTTPERLQSQARSALTKLLH